MKIFFAITAFLFCISGAIAQSLAIGDEGQQSISKTLLDENAQQGPTLYIFGRTDGDMMLISKPAGGDTINWATSFTGLSSGYIIRDMVLAENNDDVILLANVENSRNIFVLRVNPQGELVNSARVRSPALFRLCKIVNSGEDFIVHTTRRLSAVKIDNDFNVIWGREINVLGFDQLHESRPDGEGGVIMFKNNGASHSPEIVNLDSTGNVKHSLQVDFDNHLYSQIQDVVPDGNGNWIVLGFKNNFGGNGNPTSNQSNYTTIILSLEPGSGNINWQKEVRLNGEELNADGWRGKIHFSNGSAFFNISENNRVSNPKPTSFFIEMNPNSGDFIQAIKSNYQTNGNAQLNLGQNYRILVDNYFENSPSDILVENLDEAVNSCNYEAAAIEFIEVSYMKANLKNYNSRMTEFNSIMYSVNQQFPEFDIYPTCCITDNRTENLEICSGNEFEKITIMSDTVITRVYQNAQDCDSIVNFEITLLLPSPEQSVEIEICKGDYFKGIAIEEDTTITTQLLNQAGCDSTVLFHISVNEIGFNSMSNARDTVLRSLIDDCDIAFVRFKAIIDFCGIGEFPEKLASWKLDLHQNGNFEINSTQPRPDLSKRNGLLLEEYLPFGTHRLVWMFEGPEGEIFTESHLIQVVDSAPPTPVCMHGIATTLHPQMAKTTLPAWIWDISSRDNCTVNDDLIFSFSSDPTHIYHSWECSDLDGQQQNNVRVEIWVTDQSGHQDHCVTYLLLQDHHDVCPDSVNGSGIVSGMVFDHRKNPTSNVEMMLHSTTEPLQLEFSNNEGIFEFLCPLEKKYSLEGNKFGEVSGQFSTFDLLLIKRHLLDFDPLTNPYALIAADVNRDRTLDEMDVNLLQQVLMGKIQSFPGGHSHTVIVNEPLESNGKFPEYRSILDLGHLTRNSEELEFLAIPLGRVKDFVNQASDTPENQLVNPPLSLLPKIEPGKDESSFVISYFSGENTIIYGIELSSTLPQSIYRQIEFQSGVIDVEVENTNFNTAAGTLMNWVSAEGISLNKGDLLFSVVLSENASKLGTNWSKEQHYPLLKFRAFSPRGERPVIIVPDNPSQFANTLMVNAQPLPFTEEVQILFETAQSGKVQLEVHDITGRNLFSKSTGFHHGKNEIVLPGHLFPGPGMYFFTMDIDGQTANGKLIKTE